MSFSSSTKNELCRIFPSDRKQLLWELTAAIDISGNMKTIGNNTSVRLSTENASVARKLYTIAKGAKVFEPEINTRKSRKFKKHNVYILTFSFDKGNEITNFTEGHDFTDSIEEIHLKAWPASESSNKAYLRGAFLAGGSISDPEKTYHLEIASHSQRLANRIVEMMNSFELNSKVVKRKGSYVIYLKEGEHIIDFLNIVGAHNALLGLENIRILKEVRNNVNRIVNCETANIEKIASAAVRQIENIEYIQEYFGLESLPDNLRDIAELRVRYSDASLKELGEMLSPPVGKSGVNHRLRKIDLIAEDMKNLNMKNLNMKNLKGGV